MFTTLTAIKAVLGIPATDTTRDTLLQLLAQAANKSILDVFGLTSSEITSYTDYVEVDDDTTPVLFTRRWPVVSVTSITEAGAVLAASEYRVRDDGEIKLRGSGRFWACGRDSVQIVYTAGWSIVPDDLVWAATLIAVHAFNTAPKAGLQSERIGQYAYELGGASVAGGEGGGGGFGIPPEAERILANYRRVFAI
jgi:hypothetical protein